MDDNPTYHRGNRERHASEIGVLGELIARDYFTAHGFVIEHAAPLLSDKPESSPDLIVHGYRMDVKTIREDAPDLLVNELAHKKSKAITHYWFVKLLGPGLAQHISCPYAEVSGWPVKWCKFSNAYWKRLWEWKDRQ
jgi:hypothetical protein